MKTLVVAEKPSLAREIVSMLEGEESESFRKQDGYYESDHYYVSWFFGHLLYAKKPDEIDEQYQKWSVENLPILHDLEYSYTEGERGTARQGALLFKLTGFAERIVNACDPDREGEGIFRIWQEFEKIEKPVYRLWSPSLAHADLAKAWKNIKPASDYDFLGTAQAMRSYSDYVVGMNGTRAYTCKAGGELLPIGRVKTATLALIVARDKEVESFVTGFNYKLVGVWSDLPFELINGPEGKEPLQKICNNIGTEAFSTSSIQKERKTKNPPKPFSMPDLQAEANKLFGYDLDVTLSIAQNLYERKLITYPRTDSPYLPLSDLPKYNELFGRYSSAEEKALFNPNIPVFVKDTDAPHTAIIITDVPAPEGLDEKHLNIYNLIKSRFIVSFLVPQVYDETRVEISCPSGHVFRSILRNVIEAGFTSLQKEDVEETITSSIDPQILEIASGPIHELKVKEIEKKKPNYYTPATLLKAMINVSKNIENVDLKEVLRDVEGLGTAATRDQYPKDLEHDGFVYRKSKFIISTAKGRNLIHIVHPKLRDPIFTAEFESDLRKIERGEKAAQVYKTDIQAFVREVIDIPDIQDKFKDESFKCPKCGNAIKAFSWGWACSSGKEECGFSISKRICEKEIPESVVKDLLKNGFTKKAVKGFLSKKTGKQFDAWLRLGDDFTIDLLFESPDTNEPLPCPKCGNPLREFSWGWACSAGKDNCGFLVGKIIAGKKITLSMVRDLIKAKKTKEIKGFISKSGKEFSACLSLDQGHKIKFEYNNS